MDVKIDVRTVAAYKFIVMVLGCAHWIGCIYFLVSVVGEVQGPYDETWLGRMQLEAGLVFYQYGFGLWDLYLVGSGCILLKSAMVFLAVISQVP